MKRCLAALVIALVAIQPIAATAKDDIPANVTVRNKRIVDRIDWSFNPGKPIDFNKAKRCVATNVTNDQIQLKDAAGSWVGPATGNYYQKDNRSTIDAQPVFKFIDDQSKVLVAQGWIDKPVFAFRWILRYDLELSLEGESVKMVMRNIKLAMSNTGSATNDGFSDLYTHYRFKQNYASLEQQANAVKACIAE